MDEFAPVEHPRYSPPDLVAMMPEAIDALITSAILAFAMTPICRWYAHRHGRLDLPGHASSHHRPTPRNGGIGIAVGLFSGAAVAGVFASRDAKILLGSGFLVAVLAAIDEVRPLSNLFRLVLQIVIATALILLVPHLAFTRLGVVGILAAIIWIVGAVNGFNFMDGLNGLAASAAIVSGLTIAGLSIRHANVTGAVIGTAIVGGAAGFLPWNLPSGSIFMGDIGSALLGFLIGASVLYLVATGVHPIAAALPLLSFVSDAFVAVVRRAVKGERFFATRHVSHFYQRLNQQGWSHAGVTGAWLFLMTLAAATALVYEQISPAARALAVTLVIAAHATVFTVITLRMSPESVEQ